MLIMLAKSRSLRRKLVRHPVDAGLIQRTRETQLEKTGRPPTFPVSTLVCTTSGMRKCKTLEVSCQSRSRERTTASIHLKAARWARRIAILSRTRVSYAPAEAGASELDRIAAASPILVAVR